MNSKVLLKTIFISAAGHIIFRLNEADTSRSEAAVAEPPADRKFLKERFMAAYGRCSPSINQDMMGVLALGVRRHQIFIFLRHSTHFFHAIGEKFQWSIQQPTLWKRIQQIWIETR